MTGTARWAKKNCTATKEERTKPPTNLPLAKATHTSQGSFAREGVRTGGGGYDRLWMAMTGLSIGDP